MGLSAIAPAADVRSGCESIAMLGTLRFSERGPATLLCGKVSIGIDMARSDRSYPAGVRLSSPRPGILLQAHTDSLAGCGGPA